MQKHIGLASSTYFVCGRGLNIIRASIPLFQIRPEPEPDLRELAFGSHNITSDQSRVIATYIHTKIYNAQLSQACSSNGRCGQSLGGGC